MTHCKGEHVVDVASEHACPGLGIPSSLCDLRGIDFLTPRECVQVNRVVATGLESVWNDARSLRTRSRLASLLFSTLLDWVTQRHHLACLRETVPIDPEFRSALRRRWVEVAPRARDGLVAIQTEVEHATRDLIVDGFAELERLCALLDARLQYQAVLDTNESTRIMELYLEQDLARQLTASIARNLRRAFLGAALDHPVFERVVSDVAPWLSARIGGLALHYR